MNYSLQGFGFSFPKIGFTFTWTENAEIVEEFLIKLNKGPYIFSVGLELLIFKVLTCRMRSRTRISTDC